MNNSKKNNQIFEKAYTEFENNNLQKAYDLVIKLIKLDSEHEKSWALKILILMAFHKFKEAHIECDKAHKKFKNSSRFNRIRGMIYHQNKNIKTAEIYFKKALSVNKKDKTSYMHLSFIYEERGDLINTHKILKKVISIYPKDSLAHFNQGRIWLKQNKIKKGINALKQALKYDPENIDTLSLLKISYEIQDEPKKAQKYLEKILKINPKNANALFAKAAILTDVKKYQMASKMIEKAIKIQPNNSDYWVEKGDILNELKKYNEAIISFDEALRLDKNNLNALMGKSNSFSKLDCLKDANTILSEYVKKEPKNGFVWLMKGLNHALLAEKKKAEYCLRTGLKQSSKLPDQMIITACLILDKKEYAKKALDLINKDLKIKTTSKQLSNKGEVLLILKKIKESIKILKQSIDMKPDEFDRWYILGEAYTANGQYEKAIDALKVAISLEPRIKIELQKNQKLKILRKNERFKLLQR